MTSVWHSDAVGGRPPQQFSNAACRRSTAARDSELFDTTGADDGNAKSRLRRAWRRNVNFLDWAQRQAGRRSWVDRHAPRQSLHCGADVRSRGTHFFEGGARRPGGGQLEPLLDQHSLNCITPVMLPPGRLTLATSSEPHRVATDREHDRTANRWQRRFEARCGPTVASICGALALGLLPPPRHERFVLICPPRQAVNAAQLSAPSGHYPL